MNFNMTRHFQSVLIIGLLLISNLRPLPAAELLPGIYYGQFTTDRWGQQIFHRGPHHLFVADKAAQKLKKYQGKFLKIEVQEMYQLQNPGGGIIKRVGNVVVMEEFKTSLKVAAPTDKVKRGQGIALTLTIYNDATKQIEISPWNYSLLLVTRKPFSNDAMGYKDSEGRAYWYYQESVTSEEGQQLQFACREVELPWLPKEYAARGQGVVVGPQKPTARDPGTYYPLLMNPGGKLVTMLTVGHELLPGEYEVLLFQHYNNSFSERGPVSNRLKFDVVQ